MTKHVVQFSGGVGSWAAAKRVAERHGTENLVLLFADTLIEDEDLYRFIDEAVRDIGGQFVRIADGRDPWQVFNDASYVGNSRVDPCSLKLKREPLREWLEQNTDPADTIVYLGIDWTEAHRMEGKPATATTKARLGIRERMLPWRAEAPLCEAPYKTKMQLLSDLKAAGIEPPRLYAMGFPHNNCGGFCIKAGQAQFKLLLQHFPDRYQHHEEQEEALRQKLGKNVAILRDRSAQPEDGDVPDIFGTDGGEDEGEQTKKARPLPLREFRERIETGQLGFFDRFDFGGCGCALPA